MDMWFQNLIPDTHQAQISGIPPNPDEVRFSSGQPIIIRYHQKELKLWPVMTSSQISSIFQAACRQSSYAFTNTIRQGYIPLEGGHRMGVCGAGVCQNRQVQTLVHPSSLVIRCAREYLGCAERMVKKCLRSTLILGPPGSGKTTLLRDFIRLLSDEKKLRVGLADERAEISAMVEGSAQMRIGSRTDTMIHVPKAEAVMMLLRTMNPQWIAMDEITDPDDLRVMSHASYCGVHLVATAHGEKMEDLQKRPLYRSMLEAEIFSFVVILRLDRSYEIVEVMN